MKPLVSVRNLTRVFDVSKPWLNRVLERLPKRFLTAVSDVSFDIPARSTYALVGESGCGKTVLLKALIGLIRPTCGSVHFDGRDLAKLAAFLEEERQGVLPHETAREDLEAFVHSLDSTLHPRSQARIISSLRGFFACNCQCR